MFDAITNAGLWTDDSRVTDVMDDVIAGIYAAAVLYGLLWLWERA